VTFRLLRLVTGGAEMFHGLEDRFGEPFGRLPGPGEFEAELGGDDPA
jgi:hypothetical protein